MANVETITKCFTMLEEAYGKSESEGRLDIYVQLLDDVPDGFLFLATVEHTKNSRWFPKIAELRQQAFNLIPGGEDGSYMWNYLNFGEEAANETLTASKRALLTAEVR